MPTEGANYLRATLTMTQFQYDLGLNVSNLSKDCKGNNGWDNNDGCPKNWYDDAKIVYDRVRTLELSIIEASLRVDANNYYITFTPVVKSKSCTTDMQMSINDLTN